MDAWFEHVSKTFSESRLSKILIEELKHIGWNYGFVQDMLRGSGQGYITILGAGCTDGTHLPPYVQRQEPLK